MYPLENELSPFLLLDICKDLNTGNLGYVYAAESNVWQQTDHYQWSYGMYPLNKDKHILKNAWYHIDELELVSSILSEGERRK